MNRKACIIVAMLLFLSPFLYSQVALKGYVFQKDDNKPLSIVHIRLVEKDSGTEVDEVYSGIDGFFSLQAMPDKSYLMIASKEMYEEKVVTISTAFVNENQENGLRIELLKVSSSELQSIKEVKETDQNEENETEYLFPPDDGILHRIVIHFSYQPLPSNHKIYSEHKGVYEYISPQNYRYYLIEAFKSEADAHDALEDKWLEKYPNAYIMSFRGKERIR